MKRRGVGKRFSHAESGTGGGGGGTVKTSFGVVVNMGA